MLSLGIDVCGGACSVAVVDGAQTLSRLSESMTRGHVERLAPMVKEALADADISAANLEIIAVTNGPGSFTGARLGVAFARGMALACEARAVGVSVFDALAAPLADDSIVVAIDGRRDDLFLQRFDGGSPAHEPYAADHGNGWRIAEGLDRFTLIGSGGSILLANAPPACCAAAMRVADTWETVDPVVVARLGALVGAAPKPAPLYMRAPDSKRPVAAR